MPKTIQSFTVGGPDLGKANWWTNTSPSRAQMAAAASMGATGLMAGGQAGNRIGSPYGVPHFGTFSNFATQQALAGQHQGLTQLYDAYRQAMAQGDVHAAEEIEQELRKFGYNPTSDRDLNPTMAPLYGGWGSPAKIRDAAAVRANKAALRSGQM